MGLTPWFDIRRHGVLRSEEFCRIYAVLFPPRVQRRGHYCGRRRSGLTRRQFLPSRDRRHSKDLAARHNGTTVGAVAKSQKFFVTLEQDEDGWFVAKCPGLPGCVSQGKTREEAIANIREAIEGSLETRAANSIPSNIETIEIEILVA